MLRQEFDAISIVNKNINKSEVDNIDPTSTISPSILRKKTVTFNMEVDVLIITAREDVIGSACISLEKKVKFNEYVAVFPTPSREILSCYHNDLWYSEDDIEKIRNELFHS